MPISKVATINSEKLYAKLKSKHQVSETHLLKKHPTATSFFKQTGLRPGGIREHAKKILATSALAGALLLSGQQYKPNVTPKTQLLAFQLQPDKQQTLVNNLQKILPPVGQWVLTSEQEKILSNEIYNMYGVTAVAELQGQKLNNAYGRMGAEQHLPRFPGDSIEQHGNFKEKGITPALGAWGYFANSKDQLTPQLEEIEKYYVAVQTLYLPSWNTNYQTLKEWYKYRKVVVINPANGKALVAAIADAGPAQWTGKHFGGSPEVMAALNINFGRQNHPVVLFFLDDSQDNMPLGPIEYNIEEQRKILANKT